MESTREGNLINRLPFTTSESWLGTDRNCAFQTLKHKQTTSFNHGRGTYGYVFMLGYQLFETFHDLLTAPMLNTSISRQGCVAFMWVLVVFLNNVKR